MSLLGEFVRVPERLCTKIYRPGSLSQSWDFSARAWSAVALSAMGAVQRAEVPAREKLALQSVLAAFVGRRLQRAAQASLQRRLRRPAPVTGEKRRRLWSLRESRHASRGCKHIAGRCPRSPRYVQVSGLPAS